MSTASRRGFNPLGKPCDQAPVARVSVNPQRICERLVVKGVGFG
jgi:hypothetical protein